MSGGIFDSPLLTALQLVPGETQAPAPSNADKVRIAMREALFEAIDGAGPSGGDLSIRRVPSVAELDANDVREATAAKARAQAVLDRQAARALIAQKSAEVDALNAKIRARELEAEKRESTEKIARVDAYCREKGFDAHGPKRAKAVEQMRKNGLL